jgi:rubrerythrin
VVSSVSLHQRVDSDHQLARLLQIGVVLEEVVEARAYHHYQSLSADERELDTELESLLAEAAEESAEHRTRLEALVDQLDADSVPFEDIETLVTERYGRTKPEDFDGVLYDQLCNEETAYKFYDDLIEAIEGSDAVFSLDRDRLLRTLASIRDDEASGVERVTRIMEERD